jgi:hypothetical protein
MRKKLLGEPTYRQSQVALSATTAKLDNDPIDKDEQLESEQSTKKNEQKQKNYENKLIIHYTHEKRFETFKRDMHTLHNDVFKNTDLMDAKLIVGNRNRRDFKNELIRKRPRQTLLQNKQIKSKSFKIKEMI